MLAHFILCCVFCTHMILKASNATNTDYATPKIKEEVTAGYTCSLADYPYLVTIRTTKDFKHHCAGTLISQLWVLTAAQCGTISYQHGSLIAFAGSTTIHKKKNHAGEDEMQWALVAKVFLHRNYDTLSHRHDIALMELNYPIKETDYVKFVHLANYMHMMGRDLQQICYNGTIVGWREQNSNSSTNSPSTPRLLSLQCVGITVIHYSECRQMYEKHVPGTMVCAFIGGMHPCKLQSNLGGPLMCNGVQYGLISTKTWCPTENSPQLFTRIDLYQDFVHNVLKTTATANCFRPICIFWLFCIMFAFGCK